MAYGSFAHRIYCPNCSTLLYGICNEEGMMKFSCHRCGYSMVSKKAGRNRLKSDEHFPHGGYFYGEEDDFIPEDDLMIIAECGEKMATELRKENDHFDYLLEEKRKSKVTVCSFDALVENERGDEEGRIDGIIQS